MPPKWVGIYSFLTQVPLHSSERRDGSCDVVDQPVESKVSTGENIRVVPAGLAENIRIRLVFSPSALLQ